VQKATGRESVEEEVRKHRDRVTGAWKWINKTKTKTVAGITPTAIQLTIHSAGCRLRRKAREARGESTGNLAVEIYGHINSAGCEGMATTVMAAHHPIWRHFYDNMHAAQKPTSKLNFVTLHKESKISMRTVVRRSVSKNLQRERSGGEGTGNRGNNASQNKSVETVQPRSSVCFHKSFLGRRPDVVAINEALRIVFNLDFKRSTDTGDTGFLEVKEAEANEQSYSIIGALRAAAPTWEFEKINFWFGQLRICCRKRCSHKDPKAWCKKQAVRQSCDKSIWSARLGDVVLPPAGARTCEAEHRGHRDWSSENRIRMVNWEPQSNTPPNYGKWTHSLHITYSYTILSRDYKLVTLLNDVAFITP